MPPPRKRATVTIAASPIATASAPPADPMRPKAWWERRAFVAALIVVSAIPLLYPDVPPLVDLFGHMGRYRIELDLDSSPWLQQFYGFRWSAIGNLGVDLLIIPLSSIFGLEVAVKLIVLAIPPMTVAGLLWVAREVHHRLPPTALFALPFAYGFPFLFGFANFTLAMAFALLAFGLWLRLGRLDRDQLRGLLFVPISVVIFFTHAFGWGMLGLLCFSAEAVRIHDRGQRWFKAGAIAAAHAAVMGLPVAFMALWRGGTSRQMTYGWFEWSWKWEWIYSALRDRWPWFDIGALIVVALVFLYSLVDRRLVLSRNLAFSALVLLAAFLLLPWTIFGSAYADMRIVPYLMGVAVLAIRFRRETDRRLAGTLAAVGLALYAGRIAGTTVSLAIAANDQQAKLHALTHVPVGAALVSFTGQPCQRPWALPRNSHLGAMAIVRRHAFSNDQWAIEGANLLQVKFRAAGRFMADPSQLVRPSVCPTDRLLSVDRALAEIPRDAFDYVWTIDVPPPKLESLQGMRVLWRGPGSALYRIEKAESRMPQ
jgi:hypothetical protein